MSNDLVDTSQKLAKKHTKKQAKSLRSATNWLALNTSGDVNASVRRQEPRGCSYTVWLGHAAGSDKGYALMPSCATWNVEEIAYLLWVLSGDAKLSLLTPHSLSVGVTTAEREQARKHGSQHMWRTRDVEHRRNLATRVGQRRLGCVVPRNIQKPSRLLVHRAVLRTSLNKRKEKERRASTTSCGEVEQHGSFTARGHAGRKTQQKGRKMCVRTLGSRLHQSPVLVPGESRRRQFHCWQSVVGELR